MAQIKRLGLIAPSSKLSPELAAKAVDVLQKEFGLTLTLAPSVLTNSLPQDRAQEIKTMAEDPSLEGLLCCRGGEGAADLIPFLEKDRSYWETIPKKPVMGISDNTALLLFLQSCGWSVSYGQAAVHFSRPELSDKTHESFRDFLSQSFSSMKLFPCNAFAEKVEVLSAQVTGGNLTLLQLSLRETWEWESKGKILLIEDWHERAYALNRTLKHLERIGKFEGVEAVILGDFLAEAAPEEIPLIEGVLAGFSERSHFPVFKTPFIGHGSEIIPVPFGLAKISCLRDPLFSMIAHSFEPVEVKS